MKRIRMFAGGAGVAGAAVFLLPSGLAWGLETPTTGQPGSSSGVMCFNAQNTALAPGNSGSSPGSVFNPSGVSAGVYAGNPGTASLANSNSAAAVSQYDTACFHFTTRP